MSFQDSLTELNQRFAILESEETNSKEEVKILVADLQNVINELFFLKNEVEEVLKQNHNMARDINNRLNNISQDTENLRSDVKNLKNKDAGSIQMYDDIQTRYNQRLLGNMLLASLASYGGYMAFSKKINILLQGLFF